MQLTLPPSAPGSGNGIWKTYGTDSTNANPFSNGVTIGNGRLVARWWQEADVPIAYDTPPFLVFIQVALKFGTTTVVDDNIVFEGPFMADQELEIDAFLGVSDLETPDDFFPMVPTHALALDSSVGQGYPGVGVSPSDATSFINPGADPTSSPRWSGAVPFSWDVGDMLMVQRTYMGAFYGD